MNVFSLGRLRRELKEVCDLGVHRASLAEER